jgi:hypothetical protein
MLYGGPQLNLIYKCITAGRGMGPVPGLVLGLVVGPVVGPVAGPAQGSGDGQEPETLSRPLSSRYSRSPASRRPLPASSLFLIAFFLRDFPFLDLRGSGRGGRRRFNGNRSGSINFYRLLRARLSMRSIPDSRTRRSGNFVPVLT